MKRINPFKGLGIALVTPFTNEGQVDYISLEHLIEKQIAKPVAEKHDIKAEAEKAFAFLDGEIDKDRTFEEKLPAAGQR